MGRMKKHTKNRPCGLFHNGQAAKRTIDEEIKTLKDHTVIPIDHFRLGALCALRWVQGQLREKPSKIKDIKLSDL